MRFSFTVETPVAEGALRGRRRRSARVRSAAVRVVSRPPTHTFVSAPSIHAPVIKTSGKVPDLEAGDIFLDSQGNNVETGPYIVNPQGQLIWMEDPASGKPYTADVRVQRYATQSGKAPQPVLTYWQGGITGSGYGDGEGVILNQNYQQIAAIQAGSDYAKDGIDDHELTLTSNETAYVTIYAPTMANLTSVGGPANGTLLDCIIQQIDVRSGKVLWEWHSRGHVPLSDSYALYSAGQPYDAYHMNSIQQLSNGNVVVSMRNTNTVYEIDKKTGHITWRLGGKRSSFKMGHGSSFLFQHDAELHKQDMLTVFDDGGPHEAHGLEIHLSFHPKRATLVHALTHKPAIHGVTSGGNVQLMPNGHFMVSWGLTPKTEASGYTEFSAGGKRLFGGSFVPPTITYRAYRFPWTGQPRWAPSIAVESGSRTGSYDVYASWNGSTQVAEWQVLGSTSATGTFTPIGSAVSRQGFETKIPVPSTADTYFEAEALDAQGNPLPNGISAPQQAP